jgi:hypothetical protein
MRDVYPIKYYRDEGFVEYKSEAISSGTAIHVMILKHESHMPERKVDASFNFGQISCAETLSTFQSVYIFCLISSARRSARAPNVKDGFAKGMSGKMDKSQQYRLSYS